MLLYYSKEKKILLKLPFKESAGNNTWCTCFFHVAQITVISWVCSLNCWVKYPLLSHEIHLSLLFAKIHDFPPFLLRWNISLKSFNFPFKREVCFKIFSSERLSKFQGILDTNLHFGTYILLYFLWWAVLLKDMRKSPVLSHTFAEYKGRWKGVPHFYRQECEVQK